MRRVRKASRACGGACSSPSASLIERVAPGRETSSDWRHQSEKNLYGATRSRHGTPEALVPSPQRVEPGLRRRACTVAACGPRQALAESGREFCPPRLLAQKLEAQLLDLLDEHQDRAAGGGLFLAARAPQSPAPAPKLLQPVALEPPAGR